MQNVDWMECSISLPARNLRGFDWLLQRLSFWSMRKRAPTRCCQRCNIDKHISVNKVGKCEFLTRRQRVRIIAGDVILEFGRVLTRTMDHGGAATASIALKVFTFEESKKTTEESLSVSIPEVLDPQYGMYVWPCAVVLAHYLWTHREELRDQTVLELGAGVSLPGVVAARCGAKVILSDSVKTPLCLDNCRRSCEANGLCDVVVLGLTWGELSPELFLLPKLDIILGSDVFYEPQDFEDVLVTVAFLLRKNPRAQFWTTYQERSADWSIEVLLHRWKLSCVDVQLEDSGADEPELSGSAPPGSHSVQMMIITLNTEDAGL